MNYTKILNKNEYQKKLFQVMEEIEQISVNKNEKLYFAKNATHLINSQIFGLMNHQSKNPLFNSVSALLKESCYKSEMQSGGSTDFLIKFSIECLKNCLNYQKSCSMNDVNNFIQIFEKEFPFFVEYPEMESMYSELENLIQNEQIFTIIKNSFELSGLDSRILIESTKNQNSSIELKNGFNFKFQPFIEIFDPKLKWEHSYVKCLVIDGILANVHQIDQLLRKSTETKIPMIIFAKGFEGEILETINTNNQSKAFNIFPAKVELDIDLLNVLNDIAIVSNGDLISPLKGEILSLIKYDDIPTIDHICCLKNNATITNNSATYRVARHIQELTTIRETHNDIKMIEIFNNRIKNLTTNFVNIKLASISEQERLYRLEQLDLGLRFCKSVMKYGFFKQKSYNQFIDKILNNNDYKGNELFLFVNSFKAALEKTQNKIPTLTIAVAIKYGTSFVKSVLNVNSAILNEK